MFTATPLGEGLPAPPPLAVATRTDSALPPVGVGRVGEHFLHSPKVDVFETSTKIRLDRSRRIPVDSIFILEVRRFTIPLLKHI